MKSRNGDGTLIRDRGGICGELFPLAMFMTFVMMILHPIETWRLIRDGE